MAEKKEKQYVSDNAQLMAEWDWKKNNELGLDPSTLTCGSGKKVWWQCSERHEWESSVNQRKRGRGCPVCARKKGGTLHSKNWIKKKGSLADHNQVLANEWHPYKNGNLTPKDVACNSIKKVWWLCSEGHEWEAAINNRFSGRGCPYCSNKKVLIGYNDLATTHPELMREWNYEKNTITPDTVSYGSDYKVWWRCEKGHEWQTNIYFRTNNLYGCPICAKETQTSFPEQTIFYYCNRLFTNVFNRYMVEGYELDIFIKDLNVGIEYDGYFYHNSIEALRLEQNKNTVINEVGILLYRIKETADETQVRFEDNTFYLPRKYNDAILKKVLDMLFSALNINIEYDFVDVSRDRAEILNNYINNEKERSIARLYPKIAREWNYERNGTLTPEMFTGTSHKKVWWRCSEGHEWEAMISNRTDKNRGCPYCSNQKISRENSVAITHPKILEFWDYEKNSISPYEISHGADKMIHFKCKLNHEFTALLYAFVKTLNCPVCKNKKVLIGFNDLATTHPELAKEWNYEKNNGITPQNITYGSGKKVWWICSEGHEWQVSPNMRTNKKTGCPVCAKSLKL